MDKSQEIDNLLYPMKHEKITELQNSIQVENKAEPVIIWHDNIVDGRERKEICERLNVSVDEKNWSGKSWYEICRYICERQLERDDLPLQMRKYLVGKSFHTYIQEIEKSYREEHPDCEEVPAHITKRQKTAANVAHLYDLSYATIIKYESFAIAMDKVREKQPGLVEEFLNGEIRVALGTLEQLADMEKEELDSLFKDVQKHGIDHITGAILPHKSSTEAFEEVVSHREPEDIPTIRKLPKYDPDAELSSLSLTIPSWISSIERTRDRANFREASMRSKLKLTQQLYLLEHTVTKVKTEIEEIYLHGGEANYE